MNQDQSKNSLSSKEQYELHREEKEKERNRGRQWQSWKRQAVNSAWAVSIVAIVGLLAWWIATQPIGSQQDVLSMCVQHGGVSMHIHPELSIQIKGRLEQIPANVGSAAACMRPVHTHDDSGMIHLEFPTQRNVALKEFFRVWEKQFSRECILDFCNGTDGQVKMLVNGQPNEEFENYLMKDHDKIEIIYE